jgi:hypothetical protein
MDGISSGIMTQVNESHSNMTRPKYHLRLILANKEVLFWSEKL